MKRFISAVFILVFVLSCLCSCHGSDSISAFELPDSLDTEQKIEITFWAKSDTNVAMSNVYRKAIEDFQKLYPNITVKLKLYTDYGRIYNDVITNIPTKTTPNVCITYPDHIATYITGENVVVPIENFMTDKKYGLGGSALKFDSPSVSEVTKKFLDEGKVGNVQYALPFMRSSEACYVNKTYVEALGFTLPETLTWDFIWEVSEAATKKKTLNGEEVFAVNNQKVMIPFIYKSTDNMMIQMLKQKGADYTNDKGDILLFNDDTKDILYAINKHAGTGAFSTFKISSYPANFLNAGQCIFAIDSTAGATWMGPDAPNSDIDDSVLVDFETVVMPLPQFDTQNPQMISQGPSICLFNKENPQEVLASWLFMQFLLTDEIQISYAMTEGYVPVTDKARQNEKYLDYLSREGEDNSTYYSIKIQATKIVLDNTENTFITPVFNGSASVRNAAGQMIENITKQAIRKKEVDDKYISELYSKMTSLYALDSIKDNQEEGSQRQEFGKLPPMSLVLIIGLVTIWVLLAIYTIFQSFKKKIGQK